MRILFFITSLSLILFASVFTLSAQVDYGIKGNFAGGEITALSDSKLTLKTKDGVIEVILATTTKYKKVSPENPNPSAAVDSTREEIVVGDNALVSGVVSADKSSVAAKTVYVMTKADIARKNAAEAAEWRTRGINGKVVSVNPLTKEIVVSTRSLVGETNTTITPKEKVDFRRYAPNSQVFSESLRSSLGEINPGDMLRARGDKGANNTFQAEVIITGAFQSTAGAITAIDIEKNEITIMDIKTKKPVTIVIGKNSIVKQFPAEMAQRFAMIQAMGAAGAQPPAGTGGQGNRPPGGDGSQGNRQGGMRGGSIDEMLDGFPNITVADLKIGEEIAVSSSKVDDSQKVVAIKLLSGIEPFLKVPQMASGRGGRNSVQNTSLSIPGLDDGFGIP